MNFFKKDEKTYKILLVIMYIKYDGRVYMIEEVCTDPYM